MSKDKAFVDKAKSFAERLGGEMGELKDFLLDEVPTFATAKTSNDGQAARAPSREVNENLGENALKHCRIGLCRVVLPANEMLKHILLYHRRNITNFDMTFRSNNTFENFEARFELRYDYNKFSYFALHQDLIGTFFASISIEGDGSFNFVLDIVSLSTHVKECSYSLLMKIPGKGGFFEFSPKTDSCLYNSASVGHAVYFHCEEENFTYYHEDEALFRRTYFPFEARLLVKKVPSNIKFY